MPRSASRNTASTTPRNPANSRSSSGSSSPAPAENEESDFFAAGNESESSLGVPNIQDMRVDDDACLPPVHRLPNEILISIFARLSSSADLLRAMLTCKRWARNAVDLLWHRPSCSSWEKHKKICQTLSLSDPYFDYRHFVKRINLAALAPDVSDGTVMPLSECNRVERLTLTGCNKLTDTGLVALITNSHHLYSLDVSAQPPLSTVTSNDHITDASINALAENCPQLQGLNISGCHRISNESLIHLAKSCRYLRRLKLNDCGQVQDEAVFAFAENCPNILEIDLNQCRLVTNAPVTALFTQGTALRELRLANCELLDDEAFLALPSNRTFDHLRILDISNSMGITDRAIEKIIEVAPRLRNLVLQKCRNLTDAAVYAISKLGKNLHFLHLGHCSHITDDGVKRLVASCNRIRYIDLGCCTNLTDDSVSKLAILPKLKRIGLVKCANITDASVIALANANRRPRVRKDAQGNIIQDHFTTMSSLERVHLSYCTNLTQASIIRLLNSCPRLTHLSLTGVQAFLRGDLEQFSRPAPAEFTEHQRSVFCVFSGQGVVNLRRHLNNILAAEYHESREPSAPRNAPPTASVVSQILPPELAFADGDVDAAEMEDEEGDDTAPDGPAVAPPPASNPVIPVVQQAMPAHTGVDNAELEPFSFVYPPRYGPLSAMAAPAGPSSQTPNPGSSGTSTPSASQATIVPAGHAAILAQVHNQTAAGSSGNAAVTAAAATSNDPRPHVPLAHLDATATSEQIEQVVDQQNVALSSGT
ncbi:hypothetical protein VTJ83DRAFT_3785 [Remersonia thermophila]|uniref:F-box domain-containing protein n=1 Tax=Remersonia thermophila TaxID=72144 RepID=A0ABR4DFX0_9PEZI